MITGCACLTGGGSAGTVPGVPGLAPGAVAGRPEAGRKARGRIPVPRTFCPRSRREEGAPRSAAGLSWPEVPGARAFWPGLPGMLAACPPGSRRGGAPRCTDLPSCLRLLAGCARRAAGGRAGPGRSGGPGRAGQRRLGRLYTSGSQVTCVFLETGGAQTWTVPVRVTSAMFTLYGAEGGASSTGEPGGLGAEVTGTLSVTAGTVLQVNVGQAGAENSGALHSAAAARRAPGPAAAPGP